MGWLLFVREANSEGARGAQWACKGQGWVRRRIEGRREHQGGVFWGLVQG